VRRRVILAQRAQIARERAAKERAAGERAALEKASGEPAQPTPVEGRTRLFARMKLFTIGYEGSTQPDTIARLADAGVKVVVDVRAIAASRRAGFSKTLLASSLAEAGIEYIHLRQLGTPKAGRQAARAGRIDEMRQIFETHLAEPAAQLELARAAEIAAERPAALLCFEADAAGCHRRIVAEEIQTRTGCEVADL
jgi:uncharacterized protein (DUF488 family)